jgi:hypothetical protein
LSETGPRAAAFHIARISSCRQMRHCGVALYSIVIVQAVIQPSIRQDTDGTRSHISYRRVWEFRRLQTMPVCHRCPLGWKKSTASVQQRRTSCEWTCDWTSEPPQVLTASLVTLFIHRRLNVIIGSGGFVHPSFMSLVSHRSILIGTPNNILMNQMKCELPSYFEMISSSNQLSARYCKLVLPTNVLQLPEVGCP